MFIKAVHVLIFVTHSVSRSVRTTDPLERCLVSQKYRSAVHNLKSNKCRKYPSCASMLNHMGTLETMKKMEKILPAGVLHTMSP